MSFGRLTHALCAFVLVQLAGCASFEFAKPMPAQTQVVGVRVSGEELSGWSDLPIGVYRVPESQVIISGHQKGQAAGMLFGLVGVAIAHAANASAGADAVRDAEKQLHIHLNEPLKASINGLLSSGAFGAKFAADSAAGPRLQLTPALVLSFVNDSDVRPYVIIRTSLVGTDGKSQWNTRYIASTGESHALLGTGGWLENDASLLKATVQRNLDLATRALASDVSRPAPRDDNRMHVVQTHYPFVKPKFQSPGYLLAEDDATLTFVPRIGDIIVFAGVNVLDKKAVTVRPKEKDEPMMTKPVEEPKK
ncbi:hypothetical protein [Caenimonas aquaedulcis]|uniref:DUF3298 domain-containing protein n=1 Tax=Caenimonas aquaedulcis TaxID=2793270 RepID=A0A931H797_9BURK|nr:hypothetical protein [Caenimonas aquaedulcis]MBG9389906.1 hypothetical protein [Caenimonas aquaedulcis]